MGVSLTRIVRIVIDSTTLSNTTSKSQMDNLSKRIIEAGSNGDTKSVNEWMKEYERFSEDEREQFIHILKEYRKSGYSTALQGLWQIDFERQPVKFDEWLENPYYMGNLGGELYPIWQEELKYVLHPSSRIIQWILTGSIGSGKTYVALCAMLYKGAYICSCLKNPQSYFGLAENTEIVFGLFNTQLDRATEVNFKQVGRFVRGSRYFQEHCPANVTASRGKMEWPSKQMILTIGSSEFHVLGSNMFAYTMDEANFMEVTEKNKDKKEEQQAYRIYNNASRRMTSRFEQYGMNPGLAIIASSRLAESSFVEELMKKRRGDPTFHVSDYALWDTKGRHKYSPNTFRVTIGNQYRKSEILDEVDTTPVNKMFWKSIPEKAKPVPSGINWIEVPANFYYEFVADTDGSLRDIAGVPTFGISPLIWRVQSVEECVDRSRSHPFLKDEHELSLDDPEADLLKLVRWDLITHIKGGVRIPKHLPGAPRFVHCDLGITGDAAGIAMCSPYDHTTSTEFDPKTGQVTDFFRPKVFVDFMLRIVPVRGQQIDLTKITAFILNLHNYGFNLQRVTFDGFASEMAIQIIKKASVTPQRRTVTRGFNDNLNIEASVLSVDRDDKPYRVLRDLLNTGSMSYYPYQIFQTEILGLEHDAKSKKVDHKIGGSKDVSDAVCGAAYGLVSAKIGIPATPDAIYGTPPEEEKTIEHEMISNIVSDYSKKSKIKEVIPPPKSEHKPRQLRTGRVHWTQSLEGFGKHRK